MDLSGQMGTIIKSKPWWWNKTLYTILARGTIAQLLRSLTTSIRFLMITHGLQQLLVCQTFFFFWRQIGQPSHKKYTLLPLVATMWKRQTVNAKMVCFKFGVTGVNKLFHGFNVMINNVFNSFESLECVCDCNCCG